MPIESISKLFVRSVDPIIFSLVGRIRAGNQLLGAFPLDAHALECVANRFVAHPFAGQILLKADFGG